MLKYLDSYDANNDSIKDPIYCIQYPSAKKYPGFKSKLLPTAGH